MEKPLITQSDFIVLKNLLNRKSQPDNITLGKHISGASVIENELVTAETVRLNSYVEVYDRHFKANQKIRIVMPDSVDLRNKWISVFAPLSVALLGHEQGDVVRLQMDGVEREVKVLKVINHMH